MQAQLGMGKEVTARSRRQTILRRDPNYASAGDFFLRGKIMNVRSNHPALAVSPDEIQRAGRQLQNFALYTLANDAVELVVVPELGAKIISLKNLRTEREWLWHPAGGLKLFKNQAGDDFFSSPLVGIDECLPTIAPCSWQGRELPDHGEIWNAPWQVDAEAFANGTLKTSIILRVSPFKFIRSIELRGNEVHLKYELHNRGSREEKFIWAFHPLLRLEAGDQLELPDSTHELLHGVAWIDAVDSMIPETTCVKTFARPICQGWAAIRNEAKGDRLEFEWDSVQNNTLGLWLTRGGWHGHHHFAIEPTNADDDMLAQAAGRNHCGVVAVADFVSWQIRLRVGF
jgi:hypothetical protein